MALTDGLRVHGVEVGRGLVEDDEPRIAQERPGQRNALSLTGGEWSSAVADHGLVAIRKLGDGDMRSRLTGGDSYALVVGIGLAEPDVVRDGAREKGGVCGTQATPFRQTARSSAPLSTPSRTTRPVLGSSRPRTIDASVLLPLPLEPTSATVSPARSSRSMPSSTRPARAG